MALPRSNRSLACRRRSRGMPEKSGRLTGSTLIHLPVEDECGSCPERFEFEFELTFDSAQQVTPTVELSITPRTMLLRPARRLPRHQVGSLSAASMQPNCAANRQQFKS